MERRRRIALGVFAFALIAINAPRPGADIRVDLAGVGETSVPRAQAAVDLGLMGVKVLVTWGAGQLR